MSQRSSEMYHVVAGRRAGAIAPIFHINSGCVPECIGSRLALVDNVALKRCSKNVRYLGMPWLFRLHRDLYHESL